MGDGCKGKIQHRHQRDAMIHASRLRALGATKQHSNVYQCNKCGAWHVGHKPGSTGKRRKSRIR